MDPPDVLCLGTIWPRRLRDGYEFGNVRSAWLAALRDTVHWAGIERFTRQRGARPFTVTCAPGLFGIGGSGESLA